MLIIYFIFLIIINVDASNYKNNNKEIHIPLKKYEEKNIDVDEIFNSTIEKLVDSASNILILTNSSQSKTDKISSRISDIVRNVYKIDNNLVVIVSLFLSLLISFFSITTIFENLKKE